ncbi:Mu transposase C-terminal domain-containing protein [Kitasatospora sp. NPDC028055]|uniref:Mu transposase C-terminal domain-containing protein n=1 Tax=Kitasatospora sp. NPDC028055 TaxID=3155653 RepID=UPI0033D72275
MGAGREVETGHPDGAGAGYVANERYAPERYTPAQREQAKAEELTALGFGRISRSTVQKMRLDYRKQGLWGLVDHRSSRGPSLAGRTDERVVAAVKEAIRRRRGRSKGTVKALLPVAARILAERHGDAVAMCSQATFHRLVAALTDPRDGLHGRGDGVPGPRGGRAFTPTVALRPGEQVQVDTTRLDVLAVFDDGILGRPEPTIAVDVATRSIPAAVLRPHSTKAVDVALLLAEMAVPHPARSTWPAVLRFARSSIPHQEEVMAVDDRLEGAAARPVVVPETIVVDRGKIHLFETFTAACQSLGISVQPAPPHAPTAKGIVERTFGSINTLFCQYLPGYTGSNVTERGRDVEQRACYSVTQLQDLLDEWLVHWHHRPHNGLRHPLLPKAKLTPDEMWGALTAVAGHVPLPLSGRDYLELLPVRWLTINDHGIRLGQRTYDHDLLGPYRGQPSPAAARAGRWEVHHNPHDLRRIWVRPPDRDDLVEIPWIHRDHIHQPFDDRTWDHIRTTALRRGNRPARGRPRPGPRRPPTPQQRRPRHPHRTSPPHPRHARPHPPHRPGHGAAGAAGAGKPRGHSQAAGRSRTNRAPPPRRGRGPPWRGRHGHGRLGGHREPGRPGHRTRHRRMDRPSGRGRRRRLERRGERRPLPRPALHRPRPVGRPPGSRTMVNTARNHAPGPTTADAATTTPQTGSGLDRPKAGAAGPCPERCAAVPGPCSAADRATGCSPRPPRPPERGARRPVRAPHTECRHAPAPAGTGGEQRPHGHRRHHDGAGAGDAVRGGHLAWLPGLRHHPRPRATRAGRAAAQYRGARGLPLRVRHRRHPRPSTPSR